MKSENQTLTIAQDNAITLSRYDFSAIEKRCLYFVIKEVRRLYVHRDLEEGEATYKNIFENMYLTLKPSQLQQLGDEVKDVYKALRKLRNREIEIETAEKWLITSWILTAKHQKADNTYTVEVSREIMPYLVELASQFSEYELTTAISLKSTYSQRFYEFCSMYKAKGRFFLEVDKLRYMLKIENTKSYENTYELKRKVLDVAEKEIKALYDAGQCDLFFTYKVKEKEGRKIISYWFEIHTRETEEQRLLHFATVQAQTNRIVELCSEYIKNDAKYLERVRKALNLRPDIAEEMLAKLSKKIAEYPKRDVAPIIRYVLREDYEIK